MRQPWFPGEERIVGRHLHHLRLLGYSENTIYSRQRALARLAARLPVPLLDASHADLLAWREGLTVSPNQVVHYASHVRSFYTWAVEEGLTGANPAGKLPVPRLTRGLPRPISESDLMTALESAPDRIRLWLVLAGWCGLRAREIALLRRESVQENAEPPILIVTCEATKGRKPRVVPLSAFVIDEIRLARLPLSGYCFRRYDGGAGPNKPHLISHEANGYLHGLGIASTLHGLRHRLGTQAYRSSHDLLMVRDLLGHADVSTTAGYAEFDRADLVAAVESLPVPRRLRPVPTERTA